MNKKLILGLLVSASSFYASAQADISDARNYAIGQTVTIKGVVTNGSELGTIRYVQDGGAALPAFGSILNSVQRGDSIEVTGVLYDYNGLLEISPTNSFTDLGNGTLPAAQSIPISAVSESLEAQLLRFDNVTFTTTGTFVGNTNYNITDGTNTLQVRISTGSNLVGVAIPTGPVSITGVLGQFTAFQLLPRDQNDIIAYVAPVREINVTIGGTTYLNGSQYVVGTNAVSTVTVQNLGTGNLTVSSAAFSGTNASDFSTTFTNQVVGGGSTAAINVQFTAGGTGSRLATLTISSDDADEASYEIDLYAIGTNNIATEPAANPTALNFSNVKAYAFNGTYTASANTENYVVVWSNGAAVNAAPVDGVTYQRGDVIGNGRVTYVGPATAFAPRHVIANQTYHVAVFAFNGPSGYENYKTTAPLTGSVTSQGEQIGSYYSTISSSSTSFVTDLSALINPHTVISYGNYKPTVMNQFEIQDTTLGRSFVICAYSGERKVFNDPFDWTAVGYSREHSYCHSWMPSFPADGTPAKPEYSDQHNLYPTNLNNANSPRSNLPMNEITGSIVFNYLEGSVGYNGAQMVYEPRDSHKGNAARSIFYMAVAYNGINGQGWGLGSNQPQEVLKTWHFADLPDNYEIARNEYIFSQQNNRNPFVDSVDYACFIDFSNVTYDADGCALSIEENLDQNFVVFPVPATTQLFLQVNGLNIQSYSITDATGKTVMSASNLEAPVVECNTTALSSGMYVVSVTTPKGMVSRNLVIE
jgi:endonuclease I